MARRIQTLDGDITEADAGRVLPHEHLWAAFGAAAGDADLELTCEQEIAADLAGAAAAGITTIVDVTTADMGADRKRTALLARRAGLRAVKSTGWFRSPTADPHVAGRSARALGEQLADGLRTGWAGCLGEVGVTGTAPTAVERAILDATAQAAVATGAGVVLHTDDAANATTLVDALRERGVEPQRLLVGHARVADPVDWQASLLDDGCVLGFDQLGHPQRDAVAAVVTRVRELLQRAPEGRIVLSADVGRRSRLRANGGSGYAAGPLAVLAGLRATGVADGVLDALAGRHAASFLAIGRAS